MEQKRIGVPMDGPCPTCGDQPPASAPLVAVERFRVVGYLTYKCTTCDAWWTESVGDE